jgi:hypothetical protein
LTFRRDRRVFLTILNNLVLLYWLAVLLFHCNDI